MIPIITPSIMEEEEQAWEIHDPIERVERAAEAALLELLRLVEPTSHLLFLIGKGLNGADGLCLALKCIEAGLDCSVLLLFDSKEFKPTTAHFYKKLASYSVLKPLELPKKGDFVLIDALFGAGFKGPLPEGLHKFFKQVNQSPFLKISLDIPSGIDGATGEGSLCIQAHFTLSIGFPKWGCFIHDGRIASGQVIHVPLPLQGDLARKKALAYFMTPQSLEELSYPESSTLHKYERGQVLGFASHPSYRGASALYTHAAYRAGAGIVRLLFEKGTSFFNDLLPEVTQHELTQLDDFCLKPKIACVIGPGLVMTPSIKSAFNKMLEKKIPAVLDGGALQGLDLSKLHPQLILTPHLDELRRLLQKEGAGFDELVEGAKTRLLPAGLTLVIKGHHSWILQSGKLPVILSLAPSCMATAGSGDVLSGILAAYLAKQHSGFESALLGVALHSLAGRTASESLSKRAIIASDILDAIPETLSTYF